MIDHLFVYYVIIFVLLCYNLWYSLCLLFVIVFLSYVIHYTYILFFYYFYLLLNQKITSCLYHRKFNEPSIWWRKKSLYKMNKWIDLFTIGLYLFDTLLSILVLKKEYNRENKRIQIWKWDSNIIQFNYFKYSYLNSIIFFIYYYSIIFLLLFTIIIIIYNYIILIIFHLSIILL